MEIDGKDLVLIAAAATILYLLRPKPRRVPAKGRAT